MRVTPTGVTRIASYCLLLHLSAALGREVNEVDVFAAVSQHILNEIPEELHSICDGWAQFAVERSSGASPRSGGVQRFTAALAGNWPQKEGQFAREVISALVSQNLDSGLSGLGVNVKADQPVRDLYEAVLWAALGETVVVRGLRRWSGSLSESLLFEKASWLPASEGLGLLPVSWIIAARRMEPGIKGNSTWDSSSTHKLASIVLESERLCFQKLILGARVRRQFARSRHGSCNVRLTNTFVLHGLVSRWSHTRTFGLIRSDGDDWVYQKDFYAGRATSRIYQAINWLRQLNLIDETGITAAGSELLQSGLATLRQRSDKPK